MRGIDNNVTEPDALTGVPVLGRYVAAIGVIRYTQVAAAANITLSIKYDGVAVATYSLGSQPVSTFDQTATIVALAKATTAHPVVNLVGEHVGPGRSTPRAAAPAWSSWGGRGFGL